MNAHTKNERLLTVNGLNLSYGPKLILRDINVEIDNIVRPNMSQGQVVALLGPSGIGKTQLFRCIAGLQRPTSGTVLVGAEQKPIVAGDIGVVQQAYPLLNHRTVWSNLMLAAAHQYTGAEATERADELLNHFGLVDKKQNYPLELSGGQRQRVAIIQQLLAANHFLLMDEPFSGLDVMAKRRVYETILKVSTSHEHNTIIFTTHDLESAVRLADEIWILGREEGKPGATVVKRINLVQAGLAWDPYINDNVRFWPMVKDLYKLFETI